MIYELNACKIFANLSVWLGVDCKAFNFLPNILGMIFVNESIYDSECPGGFVTIIAVLMAVCCNVLSRQSQGQ